MFIRFFQPLLITCGVILPNDKSRISNFVQPMGSKGLLPWHIHVRRKIILAKYSPKTWVRFMHKKYIKNSNGETYGNFKSLLRPLFTVGLDLSAKIQSIS
jgi:hypothetical protein